MTRDEIRDYYNKKWGGYPVNFDMLEDYCSKQEEMTKNVFLEEASNWLRDHARWFGYADLDGIDAVYHYDVEALVANFLNAFSK